MKTKLIKLSLAGGLVLALSACVVAPVQPGYYSSYSGSTTYYSSYPYYSSYSYPYYYSPAYVYPSFGIGINYRSGCCWRRGGWRR